MACGRTRRGGVGGAHPRIVTASRARRVSATPHGRDPARDPGREGKRVRPRSLAVPAQSVLAPAETGSGPSFAIAPVGRDHDPPRLPCGPPSGKVTPVDAWAVLLDVVVLLVVAALLGLVTQRLGQGAILGAIGAGVLLGPDVLGLVERDGFLETAGELGVTLLMFSVGLDFAWAELRSLGKRAAGTGLAQVVVTLGATAAVAAAFGVPWPAGIAAGAMLALSSTATVMAAIHERAEDDARHARLAFAVLLLQDVAVVPIVVLVAALAQPSGATLSWTSFLVASGGAVLLAGLLWLLSRHAFPWLMGASSASRSRDLPILVSVATCLAAAWSAHRLGVSPAIGAFVAGVLLAGSPFATRVRADIGALRALFATAFFTTVGMRADLAWIGEHLGLVLGVSVALVAGKTLLASLSAAAMGWRPGVALAAGLCLAQVGEFAFVIAGVRGAPALLGEHLLQLIVAVSVLSLAATPWMVRSAGPLGAALDRLLRRSRRLRALASSAGDDAPHAPRSGHVIVLGLGPAGRGAAAALQAHGIEVVAVELNSRSAAQAEREGIATIVGDAAHEEVLRRADLTHAAALVLTFPDLRASLDIMAVARAVAPNVPVFARSRYHVHALALLAHGATEVVDEEWQTGGSLAREVLSATMRLPMPRRPD